MQHRKRYDRLYVCPWRYWAVDVQSFVDLIVNGLLTTSACNTSRSSPRRTGVALMPEAW